MTKFEAINIQKQSLIQSSKAKNAKDALAIYTNEVIEHIKIVTK